MVAKLSSELLEAVSLAKSQAELFEFARQRRLVHRRSSLLGLFSKVLLFIVVLELARVTVRWQISARMHTVSDGHALGQGRERNPVSEVKLSRRSLGEAASASARLRGSASKPGEEETATLAVSWMK